MPFFFPPQDATIVSNVDYYIHSFHAYRTLGPLPILVMLVLYIAIYGMTFYFHQLLIVVESRRLDVQIPSVVDDMFKISSTWCLGLTGRGVLAATTYKNTAGVSSLDPSLHWVCFLQVLVWTLST